MKAPAELIEPRGDLVLVQRPERTKDVTLYLPKSAQQFREDDVLAIVLRVGKGAYNLATGTYKPIELDEGDIVMLDGSSVFADVPGFMREAGIALVSEQNIYARIHGSLDEIQGEREEDDADQAPE